MTLTSLKLLCYLGRHTNKGGWCRVKQKKIAEDLGLARSTVQANLDLLYERGWVEKRAEGWEGVPANPGRQPFAAYSYRVVIDRAADDLPADDDDRVVDQVPDGSGTGCPDNRAPGADAARVEQPVGKSVKIGRGVPDSYRAPGARHTRAPHSKRSTSNEEPSSVVAELPLGCGEPRAQGPPAGAVAGGVGHGTEGGGR